MRLRTEVAAFAMTMEKKLRRMITRVAGPTERMHISREAADVANFAMMIADLVNQ